MGGTGPAGILALADVLFSSMIGVPERLKWSLPFWFEPVTGMGRTGFLFAERIFIQIVQHAAIQSFLRSGNVYDSAVFKRLFE